MTDREKIFDKIISPVAGFAKKAGNSLPGDSETYTLSFVPFLYNLLFAVVCTIKSISLLVTEIRTSEIARNPNLADASESMYSEAFGRYDPDMFRTIFYELLISVGFMQLPEISHLGRLLLVGGSLFPAVLTMQWACQRSNANAFRLHLAFGTDRMIPTEFLTTDGKYSERKFPEVFPKRESLTSATADMCRFLFLAKYAEKAHTLLSAAKKIRSIPFMKPSVSAYQTYFRNSLEKFMIPK